MGFGFRVFLIDEEDKIIRISTSRFDRIRNRDPKEALIQYKDSRIRYAMVILQLENRKPISIVQIDYGYLLFDSEGRIDPDFLDEEGITAVSMIPFIPFNEDQSSVVHAGHKFAAKRFKNEFTWSPTAELEQAIYDKAF